MIKVLYLNPLSPINKLLFNKESLLTMGAFDGIHLGHLEIFKKLKENSLNKNKIVLTFNNHPDYSLNKRDDYGVINTNEEKIAIFDELSFDIIVFLDNLFLEYDYLDFHQLIKEMNVSCIYLGNDFHYGKNGLGNIDTLKEDFNVNVIDDYYYENSKLSSTMLRNLLTNGEIEKLNKLLYKPFCIKGRVSSGSGIGKTIGFPTANIDYSNKFRLLRFGVYYSYAIFNNKKYLAICNFGSNPTVNLLNKPRLEIHILDFDEDIYNKEISIYLLYFARDETKFSSVDDLKKQIELDVNNFRRKYL